MRLKIIAEANDSKQNNATLFNVSLTVPSFFFFFLNGPFLIFSELFLLELQWDLLQIINTTYFNTVPNSQIKSNYKLPFQKAWSKTIIITLIYHVLSNYYMDTMNWLHNTNYCLT